MKVQLVDPSAFTPPYDRSLCAALAGAGVDVRLVTSRFLYGPVPESAGYEVEEAFYRRSARLGLGSRLRLPAKLAEHVPDMLRQRRRVREAQLVHWQWLTLPRLDRFLIGRGTPKVLTLHYPLPSAGSRRALATQRRILTGFDAVISHSEHGARRLSAEVGLDPARIEVIPHGAFDYLTRLPAEQPLPPELAAVDGPVILFFGLLRPYKGLDTLLEAFAGLKGAELWIAGMPRMPMAPLETAAARARGRVRFVPRFIADPEIPAYFRRADLIVLPYREIEQSGVLYTALAFGKPILLTSVGGFTEVAGQGAARAVPPNDPDAFAEAMEELVADPGKRAELAAAAQAAATGSYSWERIASRTAELYATLVSR